MWNYGLKAIMKDILSDRRHLPIPARGLADTSRFFSICRTEVLAQSHNCNQHHGLHRLF